MVSVSYVLSDESEARIYLIASTLARNYARSACGCARAFGRVEVVFYLFTPAFRPGLSSFAPPALARREGKYVSASARDL